ncbi:MAG: CsgG/HfaB family protein [Pseudomonadota bacterium]
MGFMLVVMVSACAEGQKQFDVGMQLSTAGKYKDAITYLEQALAKEPGNKKYQDALDNAKKQLVTQYLADADQALGPKDQITMTHINKAKAKLNMASEVNPADPDVQQFSSKLATTEKNLVSDVKFLYDATVKLVQEKAWVKAYFALQQIQAKFPNYEDSFKLMNQVVTEGSQVYYEAAQGYFEKDDFAPAIEELRKALAIKADHLDARKMLATAEERNNKDYFVKRASKSVMEKKWDDAVGYYERALTYDPSDKKLQELIVQVNLRAGQFYIQNSRQQMDTGWLLKAFDTYHLALKYAGSPDDHQISSLRQDLTARAAFLANRFQEQERFGAAWFWFQKIRAISPSFPDIFYLTQAMEDRIKERVRKSIAVFDFNSPSDSVDAGIIVANNLITYLFKNASGDIKILERENLKSILEEMKLGQIGVVSSNSAKEMGRVYGIDVAIMGSVLLFKVDSSSAKGTKTVRYQTGTKIEDNIEYLNWLAKNPKPSDEQIAAAPQAKITVPVLTEKDYQVEQHKKIGFIQLSFRIVDVTTGENIQVKTVERKEVVEDDSSAGLAEAGVKFDPLEIPTNTELLQKLTDEVVAELGLEALRPLQNLEQNYFREGDKFLRRRDNLNAAEQFVNTLFNEQLKRIQGSPLSTKAMENLNEIFMQYQVSLEG